jgi:hypothetical protein
MLVRLLLVTMLGELWCYLHEAPENTLYLIVGAGIVCTLGDIIMQRCFND